MKRISMYDTTLRDGSQGEGVNFSLMDKLQIAERLDALGIDFIEGGYPLSNPKDSEFFAEIQKIRLRHAQVCAFGMTRRRDCHPKDDVGMKALVDANTPVVTIVGKTWDLHVTEVLRVDLAENIAMIKDSLGYIRQQGRRAFYDAEHFFDGLKHNREYALSTIRAAEEAGAEVIILCDTNGGSLPEWIAEAVDLARKTVSAEIGFHGHNDGDLATANSLMAVQHGANQIQGTINGIGERCGNTDLIAVIGNLSLKMGFDVLPPENLCHLTEVSRFVYETANLSLRSGQPYVGASAFAHKGGMHVHAIERNVETYEHIDPARVGNSRRVLLSELAGKSNVLALGKGKYELGSEQASRVLTQIQDLEHQGYQFEAAGASFELLVRKEIGLYERFFETIHYRVNVEHDGSDQTPVCEATLKLRIGESIEHVVGEGDGPVNALDAALRKALESAFPILREMSLVDYKVRVVNSRAGTAARVRVTIESRDEHDVWGTVGVHENIIDASWQALVASFEYKLLKDQSLAAGSDRARPAFVGSDAGKGT
ncbi:citramalate synthase [bacterium]|jgi:2-isopropylmalate synthase|nr:citramalate synthase [bacterium]